jgi:hypothetical protein
MSASFLPLHEEDEPLSDLQFQKLPGNLKKSYLMMEIQEDKLQQRILRLRKNQLTAVKGGMSPERPGMD